MYDLFVLVEVCASLGIVWISWRATADKTEALLLGIAGTGLLWILTGRLQTAFMKTEIEDKLRESQESLDAVLDLKVGALRDESLAYELKRIVAGATNAAEKNDPLFREYVRRRVSDAAAEMGEWAEGTLEVPAELSWKWALELFTSSKEVFATTFSRTSLAFWTSPAGSEYLEKNIAAHRKNGARITRVFILEDGVFDPAYLRIMRAHVKEGLGVWIARLDDLDHRLVQDLAAFDFKYISLWGRFERHGVNHVNWSTSEASVTKARAIEQHLSYRSQKIHNEQELDTWLKHGGKAGNRATAAP
jgi:hypothetical protein